MLLLSTALILSFAPFSIACFSGSRTVKDTETSNNAVTASNQNSADTIKIEAGTASALNNEIRKMNFKNFTYEPHCGAANETEKITVKNGEFSEEKGENERLFFRVYKITYGDITGDSADEAIILTVCNSGDTAQFSEGFIYTLENGKPTLLTRFAGGDRAYGGLREARVENGLLVIEIYEAGEAGDVCCADFVVVYKGKWDGKSLREVGTEEKRKLNPTKRVTFE